MNIRHFLKRHQIAAYFLLTYAIAWGGIFLIVGPQGFRTDRAPETNQVPFVFLAMIAGPPLSSVLVTWMAAGREGLGDLWARMNRRRAGWGWYVIAMLTTPLLIIAILTALSSLSPAFLPGILQTEDRLTLLVLGIAFTFAAAFCEEIGWTGFATPRLLSRYSALATGLLIGLPWVGWHFLPDFWGDAHTYGEWYGAHFLFWVAALPAYRILMTWVYTRTSSVWIAQLMHASFNGSQAILGPSTSPVLSSVAATAADRVLWYGIFALSLWVLVGALVWSDRKQMLQRPVNAEPA